MTQPCWRWCEHVLPIIEEQGPIRAWIVDDTGFPKKGRHSVGVARQYCGQLGKQDNCQVAVSLSVANEQASLPIAYRLYLPEAWASDAERRIKAGVPEDITFHTKPAIALAQIRRGASGRRATGPGAGRRRLRQRHRFPHRCHRPGLDLCRLRPILDKPLAARQPAAAAQTVERQGASAIAGAPGCRAQAGLGQGTGAVLAGQRLAQRYLAGGHACLRSRLALPPCASGRRTGITSAPNRVRRNGS